MLQKKENLNIPISIAASLASSKTAYPKIIYKPKNFGPLHGHCLCVCHFLNILFEDTIILKMNLPEALHASHGKEHYLIEIEGNLYDPAINQFKEPLIYTDLTQIRKKNYSLRIQDFTRLCISEYLKL